MLVFQLISWDVIRQGIYPSCTPSHWLSQDCKILGCSPSTCFCFLYFCHNTPLLCWRPKTVILQLNIINTMEVFSAQTHQGFFLFVCLFGWLFYSNCLPIFAFSLTLDWKKINSFSLNILLNTQFGRYFLLHFVLKPLEATSVGHYTCNTKHELLRRNRHQEITPSVMSLIWNLFQIGFPIQWPKNNSSNEFSGGVT